MKKFLRKSSVSSAGNYKWFALGLLTLGYFMQQGTRQIFNSVLPQIKQEFPSVTSSEWGTVMTVFLAVYGISVLFAGVLGDLFSRKKTILISVAMFSSSILFTGFACETSFLSLLGFFVAGYSVVFALGQCLYPSSAASIVSQLFGKSRSMALSVMQASLYVALVAISLCGGWLAGLSKGSWRYPFMIFGIAGILLVLVLAVFLKEPPQIVNRANSKPSMLEAFKAFASKPSAWMLMAAMGFQMFVNFGFTVWTPVYVRETFFSASLQSSLDPAAIGFQTMLHSVVWHYAGCFIGIAIASKVADRIAEKMKSVRMMTNFIGLIFAAPCIYFAYASQSLSWFSFWIFVFGIFHGIYDSNMMAALYDVIKPRYRASSTGFMCCGAFVAGAVAPKLLGAMTDGGITMKTCLSMLSIPSFCGSLFVLLTILLFLKKDYEG